MDKVTFFDEIIADVELTKGKNLRSSRLQSAFDLSIDFVSNKYNFPRNVSHSITESLESAKNAIEQLHLATLIHDDILDDANMRRNQMSTKSKFGIKDALIIGDVEFARSLTTFAKVGGTILEYVVSSLKIITEAQLTETIITKRLIDDSGDTLCINEITQTDLLDIVRGKTAELFVLSAKIGVFLAFSNYQLDFNKLDNEQFEFMQKQINDAYVFGMKYQLEDDIIDIEEDKQNKTVTIPILFGIDVTKNIIANL